jgi:hypothetical protein
MALSTSSFDGGSREKWSQPLAAGGIGSMLVGAVGAGALIGWTRLVVFTGAMAGLAAGYAAASIVDRRLARLDARRRAELARAEALTSPRRPRAVSARPSVFEALAASGCPTPLWGRGTERDLVADWLATRRGPVVMLVSGAAEVGKARLAAHCGEDAPATGMGGRLAGAGPGATGTRSHRRLRRADTGDGRRRRRPRRHG